MPNINDMTREELIAALQSKAPTGGIKIGTKGGVVVSGFGRYPVTLYATQWQDLAEKLPRILAFIEENKAKLSFKPEVA